MTSPLAIAEGLDVSGAHTDLDDVHGDPRYRVQRPYANGVVVHARSVWGGNGFGTDVAKVAIRDGQVVGLYESGNTHFLARVLGVTGSLHADLAWTGTGSARRPYTTRTALSKWIEAVKAL